MFWASELKCCIIYGRQAEELTQCRRRVKAGFHWVKQEAHFAPKFSVCSINCCSELDSHSQMLLKWSLSSVSSLWFLALQSHMTRENPPDRHNCHFCMKRYVHLQYAQVCTLTNLHFQLQKNTYTWISWKVCILPCLHKMMMTAHIEKLTHSTIFPYMRLAGLSTPALEIPADLGMVTREGSVWGREGRNA